MPERVSLGAFLSGIKKELGERMLLADFGQCTVTKSTADTFRDLVKTLYTEMASLAPGANHMVLSEFKRTSTGFTLGVYFTYSGHKGSQSRKKLGPNTLLNSNFALENLPANVSVKQEGTILKITIESPPPAPTR